MAPPPDDGAPPHPRRRFGGLQQLLGGGGGGSDRSLRQRLGALVGGGKRLLDDEPLVTLQVGRQVFERAPRQMRVELWMSSLARRGAGVAAVASYDDLLRAPVGAEAAEDLDKDVPRTFPALRRFASPEGQAALRRVLRAFAAYDRELGYCQGLNFVAGLLLQYLPEPHAFAGLVVLAEDRGLRRYFSVDMSLLQTHLWQLGRLMPPALCAHLEKVGCLPMLYAAPWLMTCFAADFPPSVSARVMDVIMADRWEQALLKAAVGLLAAVEARLLLTDDLEDCLQVLKAELPAWPEPQLHDALTAAFEHPWAPRQLALLSSTEGAESVAEALARVQRANAAAAAAAAAAESSGGGDGDGDDGGGGSDAAGAAAAAAAAAGKGGGGEVVPGRRSCDAAGNGTPPPPPPPPPLVALAPPPLRPSSSMARRPPSSSGSALSPPASASAAAATAGPSAAATSPAQQQPPLSTATTADLLSFDDDNDDGNGGGGGGGGGLGSSRPAPPEAAAPPAAGAAEWDPFGPSSAAPATAAAAAAAPGISAGGRAPADGLARELDALSFSALASAPHEVQPHRHHHPHHQHQHHAHAHHHRRHSGHAQQPQQPQQQHHQAQAAADEDDDDGWGSFLSSPTGAHHHHHQ